MNLTTYKLKSRQGYNYYRQRSHKVICLFKNNPAGKRERGIAGRGGNK